MLKRFIAIAVLIFAFAPCASLADDMPVVEATPTPAPASALTPGLGPQTTGPSGGSNADAIGLQPAGINPLQSTASDSTGLTAPNANALQAPVATGAQLQVLANESDGEPQEVAEEGSSHWNWLWLSLLFGFVVTGIYTIMRDRQRFKDTP